MRGDRGVARRAKPGGFGVVPLGFATDAPPVGGELHTFLSYDFILKFSARFAQKFIAKVLKLRQSAKTPETPVHRHNQNRHHVCHKPNGYTHPEIILGL